MDGCGGHLTEVLALARRLVVARRASPRAALLGAEPLIMSGSATYTAALDLRARRRQGVSFPTLYVYRHRLGANVIELQKALYNTIWKYIQRKKHYITLYA